VTGFSQAPPVGAPKRIVNLERDYGKIGVWNQIGVTGNLLFSENGAPKYMALVGPSGSEEKTICLDAFADNRNNWVAAAIEQTILPLGD
jgi:hypothetical protein